MNLSVKILFASALAAVLGGVAAQSQTAMDAGSLPLYFEPGRGQAGITAPFAAHGLNSEFFITATNAQFVLRKPSGEMAAAGMTFLGAMPTAQIVGEAEMPGKINYLLGDDPSKWQSGVPAFARVRVENIYPGINVAYYGNGRQLEYDFDLAAGADPKTIAIRFDGAKSISINSHGDLVVNVNTGEIIQHKPVVYQMIGLDRCDVQGGYKILDTHTATFALGTYNHNRPLVIDPILGYSTYFGASSGDTIRAIAVGPDGSLYIAGNTLSTMVTNAIANNLAQGYLTNFQGGAAYGDTFVAKFDPMGTNKYFTYLGGSQDDVAYGLAVDNAGNAFVTGFTDSPNFPHSTNAFQPQIAGQLDPVVHTYPVDAFVTELNTNGSALIYSTFLGGSQADSGKAITVDTNTGIAYVTGYTFSTNFPTAPHPGAYQTTLQCPYTLYYNANAFIAAISPDGTNLNYGSYFGGTNVDSATAIALDSAGYVYVAGFTASTNFPSKNPLPGNNQYLNNSSNTYIVNYDAFVAKFNPGFTNLVYSTFLGGSNYDIAVGIAVDASDNAYVAGTTASTNFPYQPPAGYSFPPNLSSVYTNTAGMVAATNAFLTQLTWDGTNLGIGYSAIFGGIGNDNASGVALDSAGNVYVVGAAASTNFPTTPNNLYGSLRATNSSTLSASDVFITAFAHTSAALLYSAYLGGSANDYGTAIAVDSAGNAYVAGQTGSPNFPTFNASETNFVGSVYNGFMAKILPNASQPVLQESLSGTNLLLSWQGFAQETPTTFLLESNTNLLSTNGWTIITNAPATNINTYIYTLPHTNPMTFFRLQQD